MGVQRASRTRARSGPHQEAGDSKCGRNDMALCAAAGKAVRTVMLLSLDRR